MPTKREREYYRMGFYDGMRASTEGGPQTARAYSAQVDWPRPVVEPYGKPKKRKLSAWNKFVKANSRKKEFRYRDGKLNLKKMGVAFRRKKRR